MNVLLKSKLIEGVDYDESANRLKIFLTNGQRREYCDVPRDVYEGFVDAESPGSYYVRQVRGNFSHNVQHQ